MIVQEFHGSSANTDHPDEDFQAHGFKKIGDEQDYLVFSVSDGITLGHLDPYPIPSPAAEVAKAASNTIVEAAIDPTDPEIAIKLLGRLANNVVGVYNAVNGIDELTVDHQERQYAALAGTFGLIINGDLYAAQINDSSLTVIDREGRITYELKTDKSNVYAYYNWILANQGYMHPSPEFFQFRWNNVINKPGVEFQGKPVRSGLLTGEEAALDFWEYGAHRLQPGDIVLAYTDGIIPLAADFEFTTFISRTTDEKKVDERIKSAEIGGEHSLTIIREAK